MPPDRDMEVRRMHDPRRHDHPVRPRGPCARRPGAAPLAVLAACAALGLAACGSTTSTSGSGSSSSSAPAGASVEDQLGFDQAGITARQSRVEGRIRDCMKAQGFDYIPVDPFAQRAAVTGATRLSDEDFLKQFGYGISTLWGRGGATADPNQRVRASLGGADRRAYDRALWGDEAGATFQAAVDSGDFTKLGGCTRRATSAVFGGAQVLTQLQSKLDQLDERILEDQRMVRAVESWSTCMADAGYRYEDPDDIDTDITKRAEKIVGPLPGAFATGPANGQQPPPYDHAALAALQREEVAIARADFACEQKHITPVEAKVRPQYEAQFRQRQQALISQIKPVR
jgi:hypothetical protein